MITPTGKLYMHLQEESIDGWDVVRFLCHLLRHIPGKLLILWDRAKIHLGQAIDRFLGTNPDQEVWIESLLLPNHLFDLIPRSPFIPA